MVNPIPKKHKHKLGDIVTTALVCLLFIITFASAQPVFRTDENATLRVPCTINGTYCSVGATCYGTVINPYGYAIINSISMTKNGSVFELPLDVTQKDINGEYQFNILCSDTGNSLAKNLVFFVTPNGEMPSTAKGLLYGGLLAVFALLIVMAIFGGFKTDHIALKTGSFLLAYILLVGVMFISWNLSTDYLTSAPFITSLFHLLWVILMYGTIPLFLFLLIYTLWMLRQMDIIQNMIDRGIPIDEAYERTVKTGLRSIR
jgi:hypothetical protein